MAERADDIQRTAIPRPIHAHGAIGNLSTMALVATDGAIDFLCWPYFDSPAIFSELLDPEIGGAFCLSPDIPQARVLQAYLPDSNVLVTRWLGETQSAEIIDLMTGDSAESKGAARLIRRVRATRGRVTMQLSCRPRFAYARVAARVATRDGEAHFDAADAPPLRLRGAVDFRIDETRQSAVATFELEAGQTMDFVLDQQGDPLLDSGELDTLIDATVRRWQAWAHRSAYRGRWRDSVMRSALVLKMLTSRKHGSIAAATTFGLPEARGGHRNWDYRAVWIRDASFTVYSLMRLGYTEEATAFTRWAADRTANCPQGSLEVMYAIDGTPVREETELDHLAGYGGARPVRIGNGAAGQLQLDIYGALLDSIYLSNKYGDAISHADWEGVCRVVDYVCENWRRPDAGIWESRAEPAEHLHSRLMCWVAVDRALRLAGKRSLAAPWKRWSDARNAISGDIWDHFRSADGSHFVRSKGSQKLDGAMLMMPLVRFVGSTDPVWLATLEAIGAQLGSDGMVMRYDVEDGLQGKEGAFAACGFWYVECLARAGKVDQARIEFDKLLSYGNHLKLFSEEFDSRADMIGNFPQALTHLALISAAHCLDRALDGGAGQQWRV